MRTLSGKAARRATAALLLAGLAAISCGNGSGSGGSGSNCYPSDKQACTCAGGESGLATCGSNGSYGACACAGGTGGSSTASTSGTTGSTGTTGSSTAGTGGAGSASSSTASSSSGGTGGAGTGGAGGGGLLPFMSPCMTNAQCTTGLCFPFNMKGPHCTKMCTSSADCPAPSPGCSMTGLCRVP